jgi:hypothetical protein
MLALCLACGSEASAQRLIHDDDRDTTAQQAAAAAKQVTSGSLFDTMLRNVDAQARFEVETVLAYVREQMRARVNAFHAWHDPLAQPPDPLAQPPPSQAEFLENARRCGKTVECTLRELKGRHAAALARPGTGADIAARLKAIEEKLAELRKELKALQQASPSQDPVVLRAFAALGDPGQDLLEQAREIAGLGGGSTTGIVSALEAIASGVDQVVALYRALAGIWRGQQAVSVDPASLRPPPQQVELQLLAVEQDYLKALARIEAREHVEVGAALNGVESAFHSLETAGVARSAQTIEASLKAAAAAHDRERLVALLTALHEASAAVAQMDASSELADIRRSDEERRYAIRRSLVNARTYDQTIQAAVERLGLYWKSGLKPAELAQFAFYVANAIAVPAIALKED